MKHLKKIMAIALAVIMVLCTGIIAFAEQTANGTITLDGTKAGKEYRLYKVFDLKLFEGSDPAKVTYTIADEWMDFFTGDGAGAKYLVDSTTDNLASLNVGSTTKFVNVTENNVADFAQDALSYATALDATASVTASGTTAQVTGLELGYYLVYPVGATEIIEGNGSICSITSTVPNSTIVIKSTYPTFTKTVDAVELEGVQLGQKLNYELNGDVPDTTGYVSYIYEFKDTMSTGLTFNKDVTVKVAGQTLTEEYYTLTYNETNDGFVLSIKVLELTGKTLGTETIKAGDPIVVSYSAVTNEDGTTKISQNKAVLTYSVDPSDEEKVETVERKVPVYMAKIVIEKVDADDETITLPGAKFVLKNDEGKYYKYVAATETSAARVEWVTDKADATEVVTDSNGFAEFNGLAPATYQLVETVAPEGYNLLGAPQEVVISELTVEQTSLDELQVAAHLTATAKVENNSGTQLPGTGGIGTTVFYIVGSLLLIGAAVLLITKKRMSVTK